MIHPDKIFGRLGNRMFQGVYLYAQMKRGEIPDIYVQDPKYFDDYRDDIRRLYGDGIVRSDYVAIHYRQGDYIGNNFYVNLSETSYYQEAIKYFPGAKFLVFSDDIERAKSYFIGDMFSFSEGKTEIEDLNLMSGCRGLIIANSSYSFWGAYLSDSNEIITPSYKRWYTDGSIIRTVLPKEWKQI